MKRLLAKIFPLACVAALAFTALVGCTADMQGANSEQQENRAYMSQVNEAMEQLDVNLDSFVDAVSRGDVVSMRTQADNAYQALDKLDALEAPEGLADIQEKYVEGTSKLREALDSYITLYTEVDAGSFDESAYDSRIAEIQALYDEGVAALQEGDQAAADKQ